MLVGQMHQWRSPCCSPVPQRSLTLQESTNVAVDNLETGARFAWVTLQSLNCMEGYLEAQFRRHQGINATFMWFLTQTMANQTAAGSKTSTMDSLTKQVKKLQDEHATAKALEKLGEKLETIIKANNLKQTPG